LRCAAGVYSTLSNEERGTTPVERRRRVDGRTARSARLSSKTPESGERRATVNHATDLRLKATRGATMRHVYLREALRLRLDMPE
jgi:hypothetical protein